MSFNFKKLLSVLAAVLLAFSVTACSSDGGTNSGNGSANNGTTSGGTASDNSSSGSSGTGVVADELTFTDADMFTNRDSRTEYDESTAVLIKCHGSKASASNNSVVINGSTVTVTADGTYVISGTLNGQIVVEADETAKIQLVLKNAVISCANSAAIYVRSADKVFVTLADGSSNTLKTTGEFTPDGETNVDGVIFSKADITFNGNGNLTVSTANGHGIVTKDDLVVTGGNYTVTASGHAFSGKDSIRVKDGSVTVTSGKDGLHSEHTENAEKGFIYISGGKFSITSDGDGIDATHSVLVSGGEFNIVSGGGAQNAEKKSNDFGFGGHQNYQQNTSTDSTSCKGVKADGSLTLSGCTMTVDSADDALHCGGTLNIKSGNYFISTGDDGLHSDSGVVINDGNVQISESYEGIEGKTIDIKGGTITLTASDDGLNAAGGNDQSGYGGMMGRDNFGASADSYINITGGIININAQGDGVDSNGNLTVSGGECYVSGPTNGGNGSLDYGGTATVSGGVFVATGASGMAQNFGASSSQCAMLVSTGNASGTIRVLDSSGKVLLSVTPDKTYQCAVISHPDLKVGETYTVVTSAGETKVTLTSTLYGGSGGMGGPGGFGGGKPNGGGGRPNKWW